MPAQASIRLAVDGTVSAAIDIGTVAHEFAFGPNWQLADGTGANAITRAFTDTRTLAASATEDIDLAGGLTDALGQVLTFTKLRAIVVRAASTNTNNVVLGGASSNALATVFGATTHTLTIRPGGAVALIAPDATGYAVTATTADLLRVANSAGGSAVSYDIVLLGTT
jgi:hypothetical protein